MAEFSAVGRTSGLWGAIAEQTAWAHAMLGDWAPGRDLDDRPDHGSPLGP